MDHRQTAIEANRQIRLLISKCSVSQRKKISKYIREIPSLIQQRTDRAVPIGQLLPEVIADIERKISYAGKEYTYERQIL